MSTAPTMLRHCIAHVHAVNHPAVDLLLRNLERSIDLFNGIKTASITSDDELTGRIIMNRLRALDFHVFTLPNDVASREMVGFFERSLPFISNRSDNGLVFFCHSKGTSHDPGSERFQQIMRWNQTMWRHNVFEFTRRIEPHAARYGALGTLRKRLEKVRSPRPQPYHYSGTFYWLRLDLLKARDWQRQYAEVKAAVLANTLPDVREDLLRYFAEAYPATIFPLEESYSVVDVEGGLYTKFFWDDFEALYGKS